MKKRYFGIVAGGMVGLAGCGADNGNGSGGDFWNWCGSEPADVYECRDGSECDSGRCDVRARGYLERDEESYSLITEREVFSLDLEGEFSDGPVRVYGNLEGGRILVDRVESVGWLEDDYFPQALDAFGEVVGSCR
jgi:hypothetical protein